METCYYCGNQYHPMPVYTRQHGVNMDMPPMIYVCHFNWTEADGVQENFECRKRAEQDGYVWRKDLTKRR